MSDADSSHAHAGSHAVDAPGGHDSDDHGAQPLGPIDLAAWAYALAGSALGLLVVIVLYLASA